MSSVGGKITLVGAGPGGKDLITLRGIQRLKSADVVLYDSLVDEDLLMFTSVGCEKKFVGKKKGCVAFTQQEINKIMIDFAKNGKHTVRLKGGDPFVFGRGFEELQVALENQIPVEVVPGVSSAFSVPLLFEILPTEKPDNQSIWLITATTKSHELSKNVIDAVHYNGTVIIFMGGTKIKDILKHYKDGRQDHKRIFVIENGFSPKQRLTSGVIRNFESNIPDGGFNSPALIVIK